MHNLIWNPPWKCLTGGGRGYCRESPSRWLGFRRQPIGLNQSIQSQKQAENHISVGHTTTNLWILCRNPINNQIWITRNEYFDEIKYKWEYYKIIHTQHPTDTRPHHTSILTLYQMYVNKLTGSRGHQVDLNPYVRPKGHPIPCIGHYFWPEPLVKSSALHTNRVPLGTQP